MAIFEPVRVSWKGREYTIAPNRLLEAIAKVEDAITIGELTSYMEKAALPLGKLSKAWGAALRHAGASVTDDEVYGEMFGAEAKDVQQNAMASALALQAMMVPPAHLRKDSGKAAATGQGSASSPKSTS